VDTRTITLVILFMILVTLEISTIKIALAVIYSNMCRYNLFVRLSL